MTKYLKDCSLYWETCNIRVVWLIIIQLMYLRAELQ